MQQQQQQKENLEQQKRNCVSFYDNGCLQFFFKEGDVFVTFFPRRKLLNVGFFLNV
jgi:hypothetical protein